MPVESKIYKRWDGPKWDVPPEHWAKGETQVLISCTHGNFAQIYGRGDGKDWNISRDGTVTPSVWWIGTCDCHIWVKLEGWQ